MSNDDRPLYTLTVGEYKALNHEILSLHRRQDTTSTAKETVQLDLIYIDEAKMLTGYTEKTIYTKVSRKEIPVVSSGRPLTFSRKELNNWMESGRPTLSEMKADEFINKNQKR